jgi:hypothetical protein
LRNQTFPSAPTCRSKNTLSGRIKSPVEVLLVGSEQHRELTAERRLARGSLQIHLPLVDATHPFGVGDLHVGAFETQRIGIEPKAVQRGLAFGAKLSVTESTVQLQQAGLPGVEVDPERQPVHALRKAQPTYAPPLAVQRSS